MRPLRRALSDGRDEEFVNVHEYVRQVVVGVWSPGHLLDFVAQLRRLLEILVSDSLGQFLLQDA